MCSTLSVINTHYELAYQLLSWGQALMSSDSAETCEGVWEKKIQVEKEIDWRGVSHRNKMCQNDNLG